MPPSFVLWSTQTTENEVSHLIIYCSNCINRRDSNATYETGLRVEISHKFQYLYEGHERGGGGSLSNYKNRWIATT